MKDFCVGNEQKLCKNNTFSQILFDLFKKSLSYYYYCKGKG